MVREVEEDGLVFLWKEGRSYDYDAESQHYIRLGSLKFPARANEHYKFFN